MGESNNQGLSFKDYSGVKPCFVKLVKLNDENIKKTKKFSESKPTTAQNDLMLLKKHGLKPCFVKMERHIKEFTSKKGNENKFATSSFFKVNEKKSKCIPKQGETCLGC